MAAINYEIDLKIKGARRRKEVPLIMFTLIMLMVALLGSNLFYFGLSQLNNYLITVNNLLEAEYIDLNSKTAPLKHLTALIAATEQKAELAARFSPDNLAFSTMIEQIRQLSARDVYQLDIHLETNGLFKICGTTETMHAATLFRMQLEKLEFIAKADLHDLEMSSSDTYRFTIVASTGPGEIYYD